MHRIVLLTLLLSSAGTPLLAAENLRRMEWKVDGVMREALVYAPATAKTTAAPVVFAFHGHGGTMRHAAVSFAYQKHWPEAITVSVPSDARSPGRKP